MALPGSSSFPLWQRVTLALAVFVYRLACVRAAHDVDFAEAGH